MPIQAPQWTDYLNCPACCREFAPPRSPISLGCGHTLCRLCLKNLHRKQCPFDQTVISVDLEELVVNTALLQLAGYTPPAQPYHPPCIQALGEQDKHAYDIIVKCLEQLAVFLKYCGNAGVNMMGSRLSRPMQRKLVTLLQCAVTDEEGRGKAARAARSLGERTVTELILQHQNPQQLSANLWAAVRARGCQFLGPAMQEEVLKLVLLALEDGSALSRKVLVMFVVQRLEPHFPQASKTSIGHVVQLLYRASCFKVSKRESDSSLMQLKEEFRTYDTLRREHDAQIVQIATEAGLRIAPDQWSALLYGDTQHKSHMQSIIDKLQTPQSFAQSVQELFIALQRTGDPAQLVVMNIPLDRLSNIDASPDAKSPTWLQLAEIMKSLKEVVSGLVHYMQQQSTGRDANHNAKVMDRLPEPPTQQSAMQSIPLKYKVSMCRDAQTRTYCPRGNNCTYAHSEEELDRYRCINCAVTNGNYQYLLPVMPPAFAVPRPTYPRSSVPPPTLPTMYRRINCAVTNGNYQYLLPVMPPAFAVPRPTYPRFSVPPPTLPTMENNYNMPQIQPQISPSPRRSMVGADAPEFEQSYEQDQEIPYEHREYDHRGDQAFEHGEQMYDQTFERWDHHEIPYTHGKDQMYEHGRDHAHEQSYEHPLPNMSNENYSSYANALMHGSEGMAKTTSIQNENMNTMMPPSGRLYTHYMPEHAAYPYMPNNTGRSDEISQYSGRNLIAIEPTHDEYSVGRNVRSDEMSQYSGRSSIAMEPTHAEYPVGRSVRSDEMTQFSSRNSIAMEPTHTEYPVGRSVRSDEMPQFSGRSSISMELTHAEYPVGRSVRSDEMSQFPGRSSIAMEPTHVEYPVGRNVRSDEMSQFPCRSSIAMEPTHAEYPVGRNVRSDDISQYSVRNTGISGEPNHAEYQQSYTEEGPDMHYETLSYGIAVPRPLTQPQQEQTWPINNAPVKRTNMFQFEDRAKNIPIGMELGKTMPIEMEMGKNLTIGIEKNKKMPMGIEINTNMPIGVEMAASVIGMEIKNNMPIGIEMKNNMAMEINKAIPPIGMPHTNGDIINHGMDIVRMKQKAPRTENEKRDDQELEKELKALEQRISTEFSKASDQIDTDVEE